MILAIGLVKDHSVSYHARTMMRHTAIGIYSTGKIMLDGVVSAPEDSAKVPSVVLCHPHPMLGGDMNNVIVSTIAFEVSQRGMGSLRFDFRGVGQSEGEFTDAEGVSEDVKHALSFTRNFTGVDDKRVGIVGYSFGAAAMLHNLKYTKGAKSLVFIAPPVGAVQRSSIRDDKRAKLFIVGSEDRVVPSLDLQRELDNFKHPAQFTEIAGADHRLTDHESTVAERVAEFLTETL